MINPQTITKEAGLTASPRRISDAIGRTVAQQLQMRTITDRGDGIQFTIGRPVAGYRVVVKRTGEDEYALELGKVVQFQWTVIDQMFSVETVDLANALRDLSDSNGVLL
jgi:hypothetical protein